MSNLEPCLLTSKSEASYACGGLAWRSIESLSLGTSMGMKKAPVPQPLFTKGGSMKSVWRCRTSPAFKMAPSEEATAVDDDKTPPTTTSGVMGGRVMSGVVMGGDALSEGHHNVRDKADGSSTSSSSRRSRPRLPRVVEPYSLEELLLTPLESGESAAGRACDIADSLVSSLLLPAELDPSIDPQVVLSGMCAPVCESAPTRCRVRGRLPDELDGAYLRNGPNARLVGRGEAHHLFDGDGMVHAVVLRPREGMVSYCARFVRTSRFEQEQRAGRGGRPAAVLLPKFFGGMMQQGLQAAARSALVLVRAALGLIDLSHGTGLSNTSVTFFGGHILSLSEDDMPYVLRVTDDGDVRTLRRLELIQPGHQNANPNLVPNMCAHPKLDPLTGEMFAFCLNVPFGLPRPFSVFRVSADGTRSADVAVPLLDMPLVHDFAITRRFVIFPDNQLVMRPAELLAPGGGARMPLVCDPDKTPRFCLLPRYGSINGRAPQWFDTPGINCMHYLNAWDDEVTGEAVLVAPVLSPPDTILEIPANSTSYSLTELRFDPASGAVTRRAICSGPELELGVINPAYTARKSRYAYLACGRYPNLNAVVKVDLTRGEGLGEPSPIVGKREFGPGKFGGEPFFIAAREARSEDHGYLLCLVGDQKGVEASELLVMDTLSPTLDVIATIELPARVPPGFHGCFINQEQLSQQKP